MLREGVQEAATAIDDPSRGMHRRKHDFGFAETPRVRKQGDGWIITFAVSAAKAVRPASNSSSATLTRTEFSRGTALTVGRGRRIIFTDAHISAVECL